jgi:hypothetical protein
MKTKLSVTVEVTYDGRKFTEEQAHQALIGQHIRHAAAGHIKIVGLAEGADDTFYGVTREEFDEAMRERHDGVTDAALGEAWESIVGSSSEVVADCVKDVMDIAVDFAKEEVRS